MWTHYSVLDKILLPFWYELFNIYMCLEYLHVPRVFLHVHSFMYIEYLYMYLGFLLVHRVYIVWERVSRLPVFDTSLAGRPLVVFFCSLTFRLSLWWDSLERLDVLWRENVSEGTELALPSSFEQIVASLIWTRLSVLRPSGVKFSEKASWSSRVRLFGFP